jgi:hypothetical protein
MREGSFMKKKICITIMLLLWLMAFPARAADNSCGSNLSWSFSGSTLKITGSGDMTDYRDNHLAPWAEQAEEITSVQLPSGLTSIGNLAFYGCENLKSISIPASVTDIGSYAFAECTSLRSVSMSGVTVIGSSAFQQCESLSSVSLPSCLTMIGTQAFYRCGSLTTVNVPSSVTSMGASVFAYCTGLIRATVNASVETLPTWTFYGCTSLADVSLAGSITSAGEYAFKGCENVNTIYTGSHDMDVADKIQEEIPDIGRVDIGEMPSTTITAKSDETDSTQTMVKETENATISVIKKTDENKETNRIEASLDNKDGWSDLEEVVKDRLNEGVSGSLEVSVQTTEKEISGKDLARFSGENVILAIHTDEDMVWKIDMVGKQAKDFARKYAFDVQVTPIDPAKTSIQSEEVYLVQFTGKADFPVVVGIRAGSAGQYATLYRKDELLTTVVVDNDGYAWFSMDKVEKGTKYYIGINVEGVSLEQAVIPESMYDQYGVDATLTDATGKQYELGERSSRWGITGGRFAIYVALAIAAVVLLVAAGMFTWNKFAQSKEKYRRMAEEDEANAIDEDALRMEVMRELLAEREGKNESESEESEGSHEEDKE